MKKATLVLVLAAMIVTMLTVRWYVHWYVLPAAAQAAFIERVKSERDLVKFLDKRYHLRDDATE